LVGNILAQLDALDLAENTIVVLWGDHGWSLGEHTQWAKHSSFNVVNQVPLIVRTPEMSSEIKGSMAHGLVESVDIYPTLTELAGLETPDHAHGSSFRAQLDDPGKPGKQAVFPRWGDENACLSGFWKTILSSPRRKCLEVVPLQFSGKPAGSAPRERKRWCQP